MSSGPTEKSRNCPNCYYPLPRFGEYCSHCGQKYTDGRVTVMSLISHFLADSLNLDAKIWRTLGALLVPGRLTKTFFKGKQQRYVRPLRLFFAFAILTVAAVTFFEAEFAEDFFLDLDDTFSQKIQYSAFLEQLDTTSTQVKQAFPVEEHPILDSLLAKMAEDHKDSLNIGVKFNRDSLEDLSTFKIAKKDIAELPVDTIFQRYNITSFWERLLLRQNLRLQNQGENFAAFILNKVIWMMMLIMPLLALFMKLLYVRSPYYYVEHLIFSFHVHAFLFLVLIFLMLLDNYPAIAPQMEGIWGGGFLLMQFYFYKSLRNVYQQSRLVTFIKFIVFNMLYLLVLVVALVITIVSAALLY